MRSKCCGELAGVRGAIIGSEAVMQVELTTEEASTLKALLRDAIPDLKREIARADDRQFRHELVQREELCERLVARLDSEASRTSL